MNKVTKAHRLSVARAWEGDEPFSEFMQRWIETGEAKASAMKRARLNKLAQLVADADGAWIPCSERMPEPGEWVLCHRPGHHRRMFQHTGWGWRKEDGSVPRHAGAYTHWRPLPAEPKSPERP